jgi:hypothetical protein
MCDFTGSDVYGIRWWVINFDDDNFLNRMIYSEKYDYIMTKEQIQHAKNEYEKLNTEQINKVLVQVFVYNYITQQNSWWHVDKYKIKIWFENN